MRTSVPFFILFALGMAACGSERARSPGTMPPRTGPGADGGVMDGGSGADAGPLTDAGALDGSAGLDAGADLDAGGPADGGIGDDAGSAAGPCPAHVGFDRVGQRWVQQSNAAYELEYMASWTLTSEIIAMQDRGTHYEVMVEFDQQLVGTVSTGGSYSSDAQGTTQYRCDAAGLSIVGQTSVSQTVTDGNRVDATGQIDYLPALRTHPHEVTIGASWAAAGRQRVYGVSNGQPYDNTTDIAHTSTALRRETVTVPAGTFADTIHIAVDWGSSMTTGNWSPGVGFVAGPTSELASYQ